MKNYLIMFVTIFFLSCSGGGGNSSDTQELESSVDKWTHQNIELTDGHDLVDIIFCEQLSKFIAVGGDTISSSPDGTNWTSIIPGNGWGLTSVTYNNTQNKLVAVGYWGDVATSTDGNSIWNKQAMLEDISLSSITCSENMYVAVGSYDKDVGNGIMSASGAITTSSDGDNWNQVSISNSEPLNRVLWNGSQFVTVGGAGAIFTSPDGISWSKRTTDTENSLNGIAWDGSSFVTTGDMSTVLKSSDGATWSDISPTGGGHFGDIIWTGSQFVGLTIYDGYIFASTDGEEVNAVDTKSDAGIFYAIAYNGTRFVIVGSGPTIITAP